METDGTVISVSDGKAVVEVERKSACDGCHKSGGCAIAMLGAGGKMRTEVLNAVGAGPGDRVRLAGKSRRILFYAAAVFVFPIAAALAGYAIPAYAFGLSEAASLASALFGFAAGFAAAAILSRRAAKRGTDIEIVEIIRTEKDADVQS